MQQVIDYAVLYEYGKIELVETITKWLRKGWQPLGGCTITYYPKGNICEYSQTMVKYEAEVI